MTSRPRRLVALASIVAVICTLGTAGVLAAATPPAAPTNVTVGVGDGTMAVAWLPGDDGGDTITAFTVSVEPGGHSVVVGGDATRATVDGLANGTSYAASVSATNGFGLGPASAPSRSVTPRAGALPPAASVVSGTGLAGLSGPPATDADPARAAGTVDLGGGGVAALVETAPEIVLPPGLVRLGMEVEVTAPAAAASDPIRVGVHFLDAVLQGRHGSGLSVYDASGALVSDCLDGWTADPDPCVAERQPTDDDPWYVGGAVAVIHATASGRYAFAFGPDATPPTVTLTTPAVDARYSTGQVVFIDYACSDEPGGSGIAFCQGWDDLERQRADGARLPQFDENRIVVIGVDRAGNKTIVEHYYRYIENELTETLTGPATLTTDPGGLGASSTLPLIAALTTPPTTTGGTVTIQLSNGGGTIPEYELLGRSVLITADLQPTPTAAQPMTLTFTIDGPELPTDADPLDIDVFRNGVVVQACPGATTASPDPCVTSRTIVGDDLVLRVLTSAASVWEFGVRTIEPFPFEGFFQPVDDDPVAGNLPLNTVRAGSAIPVRFSLGGDQGLAIFETGSPSSRRIDCSSAVPVDAIEQTVAAGGSSLSYDAATGIYTYVWKTDKSWAKSPHGPCRQLSVTLIDGSVHVANFKFH